MDLGIRAEEVVEQVGVRKGSIALRWDPGTDVESLIHRLPTDKHERASLFSKCQQIVVSEGETALVLEDGRAGGALPPGRYDFARARVTGSLDVVWVKTGQRDLRWGIGNVASLDGIQISGLGVMYIRVSDPLLFNNEVVQGRLVLPVNGAEGLQRITIARVQGVLRSAISGWAALDIQRKRDEFTALVREKLAGTFLQMGIRIQDFEVAEINFPAEFKAAIAATTMVQHTGQAAILEAQSKAQISQIQAAAAAQAKLADGLAHAQVLGQLQAQGLDPLKMKALDALQSFAETPSMGALIGGDSAKAGLFGQVAAAALASTAVSIPPVQQLQTGPQPFNTGLTASLSSEPPAPQSASNGSGDEIDKLESQLDKLVERLANGEISEAIYEKLSARIESKLEQLK